MLWYCLCLIPKYVAVRSSLLSLYEGSTHFFHITVITTILRHTVDTSIGCSIAYICCSDWWQGLKGDLIRSSFVCNDARTLGLLTYICVIKEYSSFPVCWSSISSHIYVPTYLYVRLAALWDVWVCTSVVCSAYPLLPNIHFGPIY